jgi:DNA phosphorothioation-associated putative methyltransferase
MQVSSPIARHRTAIRRFQFSRPISLAVAHKLIQDDRTIFDYGCGQGHDVGLLQKSGYKAEGWDPHFRPDAPVGSADIVNLGYVLNVIEDPAERTETLRKAFALAEKALVVAVRVDQSLEKGLPFQDGLITSRGSFQKIYSQAEFRQFVGDTLGVRPYIVGLGVAYAFKESGEESRYVADTAFQRTVRPQRDAVEEFVEHADSAPLLDLVRKLGRRPLPEEFDAYEGLEAAFGSRHRINRLLWKVIHPDTLDEVQRQRREDLLISLSMIRLQGSKPLGFRSLPVEVQADIKSLWTNYQHALKESEAFLFGLGNPEVVKAAIGKLRIGKRLPEDVYFHVSQESSLPPLLRLIVFAGRQIVGDVEADLIKISTDGRKVSFLRYANFDTAAHPELTYSVKVYLPKAAHSFRDYADSTNPPILHRKEAFLDDLHPDYLACVALTEKEEGLGLLSRNDIGTRNGWSAALVERGVVIRGYDIEEDQRRC